MADSTLKKRIPHLLSLAIITALSGCSTDREAPLRIAFTGGITGYLEPCGCREGRIGGMTRLAQAAQDSLAGRREQALLLDAGAFAESYAPQRGDKNRVLLDAMGVMGYDAINITAHDLAAGERELRRAADSLCLPLISANLKSRNSGERLFPGWVIREAAGQTIGVIGVGAVRPLEMLRARADSLMFDDPEAAVRQAVSELREPCDRIVLLCDLTARATRYLAENVPELDLIISTSELAPTDGAIKRFGYACVTGVSRKGKALTILTFQESSADSLAVTVSSKLLDEKVSDHPAVARLVQNLHLRETPARGRGGGSE